MDITPSIARGKQRIEGYGNGGFTISGVPHKGSVLVLPDHTTPWGISDVSSITGDSFAPLFNVGVEILLIGTGEEHSVLAPEIKNMFRQQGIATDAMSTGAACRTYNILLAEGRRVAAALVAV